MSHRWFLPVLHHRFQYPSTLSGDFCSCDRILHKNLPLQEGRSLKPARPLLQRGFIDPDVDSNFCIAKIEYKCVICLLVLCGKSEGASFFPLRLKDFFLAFFIGDYYSLR